MKEEDRKSQSALSTPPPKQHLGFAGAMLLGEELRKFDEMLNGMSRQEKIEWAKEHLPEVANQIREHMPTRILKLAMYIADSDWTKDWEEPTNPKEEGPAASWLEERRKERLVQMTRAFRSQLIELLHDVDTKLNEADGIAKYIDRVGASPDNDAEKLLEQIIKGE
jgi:hypothetical protein